MGFTLSAEYTPELTQVPNWFIQTYMPPANGTFVKLYIYLYMSCQHNAGTDSLTVGILADRLECTENDIWHALRYWQKVGLLFYEEENDEVRSIVLCDEPSHHSGDIAFRTENHAVKANHPQQQEMTAPTTEQKLPVRQEYTPLQAEALIKDVEIDQTINRVEQLLGTTISVTHLQMILYFMCDVGFSQELILAMYKTALDKGHQSPKYIEAIGINWAKKGIRSASEAEAEVSEFGGLYHLVAKALGIQRSLAPAERELIDQWRGYGFSDEIIQEACQRTVLQTGGTNLNYVSKILNEWFHNQVVTLADIEKCDESFHRQKKNSAPKRPSSSKNQFQNFPQRTYSKDDYNALEKQLLRSVQV